MMNKILALALTVCMLLCLVACGGNDADVEQPGDIAQIESTTTQWGDSTTEGTDSTTDTSDTSATGESGTGTSESGTSTSQDGSSTSASASTGSSSTPSTSVQGNTSASVGTTHNGTTTTTGTSQGGTSVVGTSSSTTSSTQGKPAVPKPSQGDVPGNGSSSVSAKPSASTAPSQAPEVVDPDNHVHDFAPATCRRPASCACGETKGSVGEHNYVTGECTVCQDYSAAYIPKLYFTGDMKKMTDKKDVRNITFEYRSKEKVFSGGAKIKVQGTSSLRYEKKNYTINFYTDSTYSKKMNVDVGWGMQNKYCLKANWIDKTHARNIVTAKLAGEIQAKYGLLSTAPHNGTIDGFPIEVYINNEFHGLYTMNIPKDAWMFNMDEDNPNHIVLCGEKWVDAVYFNEIPTDYDAWAVEVGPEDDATLAKLQRLASFIKNSSDEEFKENFSKYLNLDSTLNYYIMMEYAWLYDNAGKNMLLVTYDGNVWYPSLYDLDTSWGMDWQGLSEIDYKTEGKVYEASSLLWKRMEALYKDEISTRYFELRSTVLDVDNVMGAFNRFYNGIPQEVLDREMAKWNTSSAPIPGRPISQIEQYINCVIPRLDEKFSTWDK